MIIEQGKTLIQNLRTRNSTFAKTMIIVEHEVKLTNMTLYFNDGYRKLTMMEQITSNLPTSGLIFIGSPCMDIKFELLNRVRLNTIKSTQVFFPIPFAQYLPTISNSSSTTNDEIEINKNFGYFDSLSYEFSSFYNADFQSSRNEFIFSKFVYYYFKF